MPRPGRRRETALKARDRTLLAALGMCRALTLDQVVELFGPVRDVRTVKNRLRALAGDTGNVKLPNLGTVVLRRLRFRAFDGAPLILWAPTPVGHAIAHRELGREPNAPRGDIGVAFAEHFVALTDVFVNLAGPYVRAGVAVRDLPFVWDVAEDTRLPWREPGEDGRPRDRIIRPDAVLALPGAQRRLFLECEMGTHTLVSVRRDRHQATVHKAQRYETFLAGLAEVKRRTTHYAKKYPDGWPAEVLFLVQSEARRTSTEAALASVVASAGDRRITLRVFTLEQALAYVQGLLPPVPATIPEPPPSAAAGFYGEAEHQAVNAFVIESTTALAQANAALRRHGEPEVADPPSVTRMLAFLRKALTVQ